MPVKLQMNKRNFLKAGLSGLCGMCAAGLSGCGRREEEAVTVHKGKNRAAGKVSIEGVASPWFSNAGGSIIRCELCPRQCLLQPGERGPCRVRENRNGQGYTLAHGNPALVQEDAIERKPFFHVLPGKRALSISTAGCNLSCRFCEVWDMALVAPEEVLSYDMPPQTIIEQALAANLPAVSYAFGEPVVFYEYMTATASLAKEAQLMNLMHTAAYILPEPLQKILPLIDAANIDLKSFDQRFYRDIVGGELKPVLEALKLFRESGTHLELTNIVIPTLNDDMGMIAEMCSWIADELGPETPLHFARFYPLHRLSDLPQTAVSTLDRARETALNSGLKYVYVARVTGHEGENTFCPSCHEKIIKRLGFIIDEMHIENGACSFCNHPIPGIWTAPDHSIG